MQHHNLFPLVPAHPETHPGVAPPPPSSLPTLPTLPILTTRSPLILWLVWIVSLLTTLVIGMAQEPILQHRIHFQDGQKITGTITPRVELETSFGRFGIKSDQISAIHLTKTNNLVRVELENGDLIGGSISSPLTCTPTATDAPKIDLREHLWNSIVRSTTKPRQTRWEIQGNWRTRLSLLEAPQKKLRSPTNNVGELVLLVEIQNQSRESQPLTVPTFQHRIVSPGELRPLNSPSLVLTAFREGDGNRLLQEAQQMPINQVLTLLPGACFECCITVPYWSHVGQIRDHHEIQRQLEEIPPNPQIVQEKFRVHVASEPLQLDRNHAVQFRAYFASGTFGKDFFQLRTPALKVDFSERSRQ